MAETRNYERDARDDAWETLDNFVDDMVEQWRSGGEVSDDLHNDYSGGDEYHHSYHVDRDYRLKEASDLLDQLSQYEEDDEGLWQGAEPRKAIAIQAAYTYGNAVLSMFRDLVDDLNGYLDALRDTMIEAPQTGPDDIVVDSRAAGERLIRTFVLFADRDPGEFDGLLYATWGDVQCGGLQSLLVLADKAQETGHESFARSCRDIAKVVAEAEEGEEEAA